MHKDYIWVSVRITSIEWQTTEMSNKIIYIPREVVLQPFAVRQRFGKKKRKTRLL